MAEDRPDQQYTTSLLMDSLETLPKLQEMQVLRLEVVRWNGGSGAVVAGKGRQIPWMEASSVVAVALLARLDSNDRYSGCEADRAMACSRAGSSAVLSSSLNA